MAARSSQDCRRGRAERSLVWPDDTQWRFPAPNRSSLCEYPRAEVAIHKFVRKNAAAFTASVKAACVPAHSVCRNACCLRVRWLRGKIELPQELPSQKQQVHDGL